MLVPRDPSNAESVAAWMGGLCVHERPRYRCHPCLSAAFRHLASLATVDPLTRALNRRGIEAAVDAAVKRARRVEGCTFCVIMADVDDFKRVNDTRGHAEGDKVLQLVGCALRACSRATDHVGRWGGEEFLIVTENALEGAVTFAERLRDAVRSTVHAGGEPVTISLGVAPYEGSWERCLAGADAALYAAKAGGKDRVAVEHDRAIVPAA